MIIPFSEIVNTQKGKNPLVKSKTKLNGYIPYIDIKAFEQGIFDTYTDGNKCLLCDDGDILLVWDGARAGLVGVAYKGAVGSTLVRIDVPLVEKKYVLYFFNFFSHELNAKLKGTGIPHINHTLFNSLPFPLSPTSEQQRIVAKIDSLFSELENGVTLLKNIKAQLAIYRQAVLKWAFEQGHSAIIVKLCDIADIVGGITKGRDLTKCETILLPYLRVANVQDGYLDLTNIKKIELKLEEKNKYLLQMDDVLYTEGGDKDKLGRGTIWKNEIKECVHQNHIFRARINTKMALPKYVAYFSLTKSAKDYFFKKAKQTVNLASINMTVLRSLSIPLPNLSEQQAIVSAIESRLSVCDKLEQTIDQTIALSASLRQSILKKAFEGRLVPQDPNDEPSEKLLERIKAEKAAVLAKQKQTWKRGKK
jgi:Restriction endonuclease S subunits